MKRWWPILLVLGVLCLWTAAGEARPGGGHSYSSGGGSYSSGGGGYSSGGGGYSSGGSSSYEGGGEGGGELFIFLFQLVFEAPAIGIPLMIIIFGAWFWIQSESNKKVQVNWSSLPVIPPPPPELEAIRRLDPEFSTVLFEDFIYHLYAEAHGARRSDEAIALLAPHFGPEARKQLASRSPGAKVDRVVIGSMAVSRLTMPDRATTDSGEPYYLKIALRFESNMRVGEGEDASVYYVDETWMLARAANALSVPPERMRASLCSNCGAPFADTSERLCSSCGEAVDDGRFGWLVTSILLNKQETRPQSLTGYAPERGTYDTTLEHPRKRQELKALQLDDPAFTVESFTRRARLIFMEMYQAWNDDDIARARPFVSDALFNYLRYWLDAYRHEGLENWVEDFELTSFAIAKVVRDRHYDAITIRLWAIGKDYTLDTEQRVVGGSKKESRYFSEYWTMIRKSEARGATSLEKKCPNCGAEQRISMAGICEFCSAHITSGEFDWVLSKIQQDESYRG